MNRGNYANRQVNVGGSRNSGGDSEDMTFKLTNELPHAPNRPVYHRSILYVHNNDPHSGEALRIAPRLLGDFIYVQDVTEFQPHQRPSFLRQTPTLVIYREDNDKYDVYVGRDAKQMIRSMNEVEPCVGARLAGKFGACAVIPPSYEQIGCGGSGDLNSDRPDKNVNSEELVERYLQRKAEENRFLQNKMDRLRAERASMTQSHRMGTASTQTRPSLSFSRQ